MNLPEPKVVDLTPEEQEWLMTVYTLCRKSLFFSGCFRCLLGCFVNLVVLHFFLGFLHDIFLFDYERLSGAVFFQALPAIMGGSILLSILSCVFCYYAWIQPYRDDAVSGKKIKQPYRITQKEFFDITGQYFIRLDNGMDEHYEVGEEVYNSCEEGGIIYLDQAKKSRYIFRKNNHTWFKMFHIERGRYRNYNYDE